MRLIPSDKTAYRRTPVFTRDSLPPALTRNHSTAPGVWGKIHVLRGRLAYEIDATQEMTVLVPGVDGVIEPGAPHRVEPLGDVSFFVEFYR
ncbi:MAG: DUF1971 domain-containing protein [Kiloniellales bacterium]|nr:DUF1971 domain-containing protein [Kiloniellales bacterium]